MDNTTNIALSRLIVQQRAVDVIAGNLANVSTPGYRAERTVFADWLLPQAPRGAHSEHSVAFTQDRATYREQAEGALNHTGNPLDLALSGDGYFTVKTASGTRLTRAGRFTLQADGTITDANGNSLLDTNNLPLRVTQADTRLTVAGDGTISSENGTIGKVAVVRPADPFKLVAEGSRLLRADVSTRPMPAPKVIQGAVEDSNVQPVGELTRMMNAERDFQFVTQFVEAEGQREQSAIDKIVSPQS